MCSASVLGTVVHEGMDWAAVELLDLEKVLINKFTLILGAVIIYEKLGIQRWIPRD